MIEREAIPMPLRKETTVEFCKERGIAESTYYFQSSKRENMDIIEEICFKNAKKHTPEILENLGVRAKDDHKDAQLYLEFILERKKKMDITTDNKPIGILTNALLGDNSNKEDNADEEENQSDSRGDECIEDSVDSLIPDTPSTRG